MRRSETAATLKNQGLYRLQVRFDPLRADPHRHQNVEERCLDFQDARAHLIDQIEKDLVFGKVAQRRHEKLRIKCDGKVASLIDDWERLLGLAYLRGVGSDMDVVLTEV